MARPSRRLVLPLLLMAAAMTLPCTSAQNATAESCELPPTPDATGALIDLLGGLVVKPSTPLTVTAWKGDATLPGFVFPELSDGEFGIPSLQAKPNFGIGISGGGLRATSLSLGWLRGLNSLGLLRKARYLGSASGGTFTNVMVSFTDPARLSQRLGAYLPPAEASVARLKNLASSTFAYTIAHMDPTFYQTFIEAWASPYTASPANTESESAFARTIALVALNPLNLGLWNSTVSARGTRGSVHLRHEAIARQLNLSVYSTSSNSPFPLITGNILDSTEPMYFYPFEMTPLYSGSPCNFTQYTTQAPKGGGLVEAMGFNGHLASTPAQPLETGRAQNLSVTSRYIQPLVGRVSVSGGILGIELQKYIQASPGNGTLNSAYAGQPFYEVFNFHDYTSQRYPFGDGGYTDNEGLVAMLRRKVKKILLFYAVANPTTNKDDWSAANSGLSLPFGRCVNCYTYLSANLTDDLINTASRVFAEQGEFDRLFNEYQENVCNGTVNYFRANLTVLENKFLGVPGGWQVELMVVMNAVTRNWESQLHPTTKALLNKSRTDPKTIAQARLHPLQTSNLVDFPFYNIGIFSYNSLAVSIMSQMATWQVMELQQQLHDFVGN